MKATLYQIGCVSIALIAALQIPFSMVLGPLIAPMAFDWNPSAPFSAVPGWALALSTLLGLAPPILAIRYRREIVQRWVLPDPESADAALPEASRLPGFLAALLGFYLQLEGLGDLIYGGSLAFWPIAEADARSVVLQGVIFLGAGTLIARGAIRLLPQPEAPADTASPR